jgi:hypothetical protein
MAGPTSIVKSEIPKSAGDAIAHWRRIVNATEGDRDTFHRASVELLRVAKAQPDPNVRRVILAALCSMGKSVRISDVEVQSIMTRASRAPPDKGLLSRRQSRTYPRSESGSPIVETNQQESPPVDYGSVPEPVPPTQPSPATLITPAQWPNNPPPAVDWLVRERIPRGDVTTLHGDGGAGKTDIALRLAANVPRGAPEWLGHEIAQGPTVFVSAEETEREVRRRLWLHGQRDGYALGALTGLFIWLPDQKAPDAVLAVPDRQGIMRPTPLFESIRVAINNAQPVLVIVDNVAATFAGNQNDRVMVRTYVNLWRAIARIPSRPAVLLLDHPSLSGLTTGTGRGGNMDWRNAVRSALYLYVLPDKAEADRGIRILETV